MTYKINYTNQKANSFAIPRRTREISKRLGKRSYYQNFNRMGVTLWWCLRNKHNTRQISQFESKEGTIPPFS